MQSRTEKSCLEEPRETERLKLSALSEVMEIAPAGIITRSTELCAVKSWVLRMWVIF